MDAKEQLQRRQVSVYAVAVVLAIGVVVGRSESASLTERPINPVLTVLLYVTVLEIRPGPSPRGRFWIPL